MILMFNNIDLFTQALGIEDPWKLDKIDFNKDDGRLDIYISHKRGSKFPCPECGEKSTIHDTKERTWRHLNFFQYRAYIHAKMPRTKCTEHGVLQVKAPWAEPGSGFTMLFEAFIMELATAMTVNEIADLVGEHDTRLWRILTRYVGEARAKEDYSSTDKIGIDETSSKKGHNYITIFVDLDQSKIIYITEGKDSSTVDSFALNLKSHNGDPKNIKKVCCDMSPAFIKGVAENFSQAKVTFDKFHVMKAVNKAVDQVRRNEQSDNKELKKTRYIWLKNKNNLTKKQQEKFKSLSEMNLKTMRAYNLRLALQEFWDIDDITTAAIYLQKWYLWAIRSQLEPMVEIGQFINRHWQGIMNYIESHINNGILEGLNSIVQTIKRKARGFRNLNNFMTAIYLQCGKLDFDLPQAFI